MKYRHEIAEEAVAALAAANTDLEIATALAGVFAAHARGPTINVSINHNAKAALCPLRIDAPGVKRSSVTLRVRDEAIPWMIEAFQRGYEVTSSTMRGIETASVAAVRREIDAQARMAAYRAERAAKVESGEDPDDDIPF